MKIYNMFKNLARKLQTVGQKVKEVEYKLGLIADYVVEYSNNQNNGYTKWASGKLECWKREGVAVSVSTSWGSGIYYGSISPITYPVAFIQYPIVNITGQVSNGGAWIAPNYDNYSTENTGTIYFCRVGSSRVTCTVNVYAVGKWK